MPRPRSDKVKLYVKLPVGLKGDLARLQGQLGARYLSEVVSLAIERALDRLDAGGSLHVPVTAGASEGCQFKIEPALLERLDAATASGIQRHNIVRAGIDLLAREHEGIAPRKPRHRHRP